MSLEVIFRSAALADVESAYRWYEKQQPKLGTAFMDELGGVEGLLRRNPELFGKVRGEVRRGMLNKFPYGVFYIVRPEFISVIGVLHHARSPRVWQNRG